MKKTYSRLLFYFITGLCLFTILSCSSQTADELPMFGGQNKTPALEKLDQKFIEEAVKAAGTKEKAGAELVEKGRELINKGDLAAAMKRFNQAWLLTPDNAEVFRGFGVVLGAKRQFDEALKMFKKAVELDPRKAPLKADFANIYVGKAYFANGIERRRFIKEALALYSEANALDPKAGDVLIKWAIALYYAGSFRESWDKVHEAQKTGIKVEERFLRDLNRKFPEATAAQIEK